jgi:hypothetical protein
MQGRVILLPQLLASFGTVHCTDQLYILHAGQLGYTLYMYRVRAVLTPVL